MNPFLAGTALQVAGGLIGGRARKKAANQARRDAFDTGDDIVRASKEDQQRAIEYRDADQARMDERGAVGVDFKKLRDDAIAAGFNPLTALAATGGAGYDRPGVLTTPFIPVSDAFSNRAALVAGTGQAMIETAGYFGDVLSGVGSNFIGLSADQAERAHETRLLQMQLGRNSAARSALGGSAAQGGFTDATRVTASPMRPRANPFATIRIFDPEGYPMEISRTAAELNGIPKDYWMLPGDWENWMLGESGQALSANSSVKYYDRAIKAPIGPKHAADSGWVTPAGPAYTPAGAAYRAADWVFRRMTGQTIEQAWQ